MNKDYYTIMVEEGLCLRTTHENREKLNKLINSYNKNYFEKGLNKAIVPIFYLTTLGYITTELYERNEEMMGKIWPSMVLGSAIFGLGLALFMKEEVNPRIQKTRKQNLLNKARKQGIEIIVEQ